jgi:hypothetical protein
MAILFGNDLSHLILNAETSTLILEADYRFAQPPAKPVVQAVAGDGKVTLYWDSRAEESVDPLSGQRDFQGYKIYRSRDYTFSDVFTITDGMGNAFLGRAMNQGGADAQFDLDDNLSGYHPVDYAGRGIKFYLGDNTGLVHEYVDSSVSNGVNYYYAVVAYDHGTNEIPPTETQAVILKDPVTGELTFESNTAQVVPNPLASGTDAAEAGIGGRPEQIRGNSTGEITVKILDDLMVQDKLYLMKFIEPEVFSILDSTGVTEEFVSKDTVFVDLSKTNIQGESMVVTDASGSVVDNSRYVISENFGKISGANPGDLPEGEVFTASYSYYPVYKSNKVDSSDANPSFDGMKIYVNNHELDLAPERCEWDDESSTNVIDSVLWSSRPGIGYIGNPHVQYRADWEFRWLDADTLEDGSWANVGDTLINVPDFSPTVAPFYVVNVSEVDENGDFVKGEVLVDELSSDKGGNGMWDWGEPLLLRPTGSNENTPPDATVSYYVNFFLQPDIVEIDSTVIDDSTVVYDTTITPVETELPEEGDIYFVRTDKPFETGDMFEFETKAVEVENASAAPDLNDIYVVPNPYVAYSMAEEPGRTADKRGDRQLQFRNLPPQCTIRIYTAVGELVQTIEKDDLGSIAYWDLLSFEGQRVAYGVYIFHVDAPGSGEKIGRFALIK